MGPSLARKRAWRPPGGCEGPGEANRLRVRDRFAVPPGFSKLAPLASARSHPAGVRAPAAECPPQPSAALATAPLLRRQRSPT